jgi:hypothetical protein
MKKKVNEIKGLLLSNKQMKELKGGLAACVSRGGTCSLWNGSYMCTFNGIMGGGCAP